MKTLIELFDSMPHQNVLSVDDGVRGIHTSIIIIKVLFESKSIGGA
jgi:hypothetical protein